MAEQAATDGDSRQNNNNMNIGVDPLRTKAVTQKEASIISHADVITSKSSPPSTAEEKRQNDGASPSHSTMALEAANDHDEEDHLVLPVTGIASASHDDSVLSASSFDLQKSGSWLEEEGQDDTETGERPTLRGSESFDKLQNLVSSPFTAKEQHMDDYTSTAAATGAGRVAASASLNGGVNDDDESPLTPDCSRFPDNHHTLELPHTPPAPQATSLVIDDEVNCPTLTMGLTNLHQNDVARASSNSGTPSVTTTVAAASGNAVSTIASNEKVRKPSALELSSLKHPFLQPPPTPNTSESRTKKSTGGVLKLRSTPQEKQILTLLYLPTDALHCITTFMDIRDLSYFSLVSRNAAEFTRKVFSRVRMHAFKCAVEVVTAWEGGEHADARELTALYIQNGVPIYPARLGHAYQTMIWRMKNETKEMEQPSSEDDEGNNTNTRSAISSSSKGQKNDVTIRNEDTKMVDRFFLDRNHSSNSYVRNLTSRSINTSTNGMALTYTEEKGIYWKERCFPGSESMTASARNRNMRNNTNAEGRTVHLSIERSPNRQTFDSHFLDTSSANTDDVPDLALSPTFADSSMDEEGEETALEQGEEPSTKNSTNEANEKSPQKLSKKSLQRDDGGESYTNPHVKSTLLLNKRSPKVRMNCHKHLVDQHYSGRQAVLEENGNVKSSPVSLSADFFHPASPTMSAINAAKQTLLPPFCRQPDAFGIDLWRTTLGGLARADDSPSPPSPRRSNIHMNMNNNSDDGIARPRASVRFSPPSYLKFGNKQHKFAATLGSKSYSAMAGIPFVEHSVMNDIILSPYSSNLGLLKIYNSENMVKCKSEQPTDLSRRRLHVRERFIDYEQKLDALLNECDQVGVEECMLDFWDEFFPQTACIHFYDKQSPVPRVSRLREFLTNPCPKNLGTVQCEIERVRVTPKKKGVNMKSRFFPTYEYRLFIRDRRRRSETDHHMEEAGLRLDTVLMSAKCKSKKQQGSLGGSSKHAQDKKSVNNYYFYLPQREDVEEHFNSANAPLGEFRSHEHSAQKIPSSASCMKELGRLQSNFIGTEFQIFSSPLAQDSEIEKTNTENPSPTSTSTTENEESTSPTSASSKNSQRRRLLKSLSIRKKSKKPSTGLPDQELQQNDTMPSEDTGSRKKPWLRSRRAIANATDLNQEQKMKAPLLEIGAITYTANLLGNRPRIMDVCIPEVNSNAWINYSEQSESGDGEENSMLSELKAMQQTYENNDPIEDGPNPVADETASDHGLLALQNRPPWWNAELGAFVLNFGGRVRVASVKNFQLCDRANHDDIMLQFGRIEGRHSFTMDFSYPLSAMQAFAIAVSSLQSKISFG